MWLYLCYVTNVQLTSIKKLMARLQLRMYTVVQNICHNYLYVTETITVPKIGEVK